MTMLALDAVGRHRHRRRDRRPREHLPLHRGEAREPVAAAAATRQEIGLAVLATTLSLVAIFVPVAFMGGIVGRFMKSFGLTMAFAIMVSLLVSFTLTPMLAARWLKIARSDASTRRRRTRGVFHAIDRVYTRILEWSMAHRGIVAGVACSSCHRACRCSQGDQYRTSCRTTIRRSSRSTCARPKAPASRPPKSSRTGSRARVRQQSRGRSTRSSTIGGDPAKTRNLATSTCG